jgi:hypothetical protein
MTTTLLRVVAAGAVLVVWLAYLASRQTALYPTIADPATEIAPGLVVLAAIAAAVVGRLLATSTLAIVATLAVMTGGIALLAAQLGSPLANASGGVTGGDYCGDQCRGAIAVRFVSFFGWPILTSIGLVLLGRQDRAVGGDRGSRAAWTRAWSLATLAIGLPAAAVWWQIILPKG